MADTYCTTAELAAQVGITDTNDDLLIAGAIDAASRQIDAWCGRRFWQDATVTTREFYPHDTMCLDLLEQPGGAPAVEISTATGLIVKTDTGDNGAFATTLTINTDFLLFPRNADDDARPWNEIQLLTTYFPSTSYRRAPVQITAKFGWATIPDDVTKACILQATQLYKAKDAVGGAEAAEVLTGTRPPINVMARALLAQYQLPVVG